MAESITTEAAFMLADICINAQPDMEAAERWLAEAGQMIEALVRERDELKREHASASEVLADAAAQDAELKLLRGLLKECRPYVQRRRDDAECEHDSPGSEGYQDFGTYEDMQKADALLAQIDLSTEDKP